MQTLHFRLKNVVISKKGSSLLSECIIPVFNLKSRGVDRGAIFLRCLGGPMRPLRSHCIITTTENNQNIVLLNAREKSEIFTLIYKVQF